MQGEHLLIAVFESIIEYSLECGLAGKGAKTVPQPRFFFLLDYPDHFQ